jgi:ABC-type transport system involved in multi-copper enzyme maturation permease subunit
MFWQMVRVEQKKLTSRKILWVEIAIVAALAAFIPLIIYLASQSDGGSNGNLVITTDGSIEDMIVWPSALRLGLEMASGSQLGGLLIVILVGALTAQEYGWRTMQLWLSKGISRPLLLLAKFTVVLLPALLLVLTPFVAGGLTTAVFTQQLQGNLPFAEVNWWQAALSIGRTAYTLLPYAALTFFLAIVSRSTVVAIGGGLAYTMLIEGVFGQILLLVGGSWAKVGQYMPAGLANSLSTLNRVTTGLARSLGPQLETVNPETAVIGIALYTILFVSLALFAFRRQDLGG